MTDPLAVISTRRTLQSQPASADQVANSAGGYVFQIDDMVQLHRFLTIGSTGGTYYVSEKAATFENAQLVLDLARTRTLDVVKAVVAVSVAGRAPRQQPGLFALAACAKLGTDEGRQAANRAVPLVARTASTLFTYVKYMEQFGGWSRGSRRAVANWYLDKEPRDLAYQVAKYRQRDGWTHRDLLRMSHPSNKSTINRLRTEIHAASRADSLGSADYLRELESQLKAVQSNDLAHRQVFDWISGRAGESMSYPGLEVLEAFDRLQHATTVGEALAIVKGPFSVSWEMVPDQFLNEPKIWEALLGSGVPLGAMIRQLPRLTRLGLVNPMGSSWTTHIVEKLTDPEQLKRARIHPINALVAQRTYASGRSARGESTWTPSRPIVDALDAAFYAAYGAIEPAGKRTLLALDVSGSMGSAIAGMPISCREASAAISLVTAATEPQTMTVGFTAASQRNGYGGYGYSRHNTDLTELAISPRQRLDDVISTVNRQDFGATDCALPMLEATKNKWEIDTFCVLTDNETWAGNVHPFQALKEYRQASGIDARLVVMGMTASKFSIADPSDPGMLDIAGLDSAVPNLIADFSRGAV